MRNIINISDELNKNIHLPAFLVDVSRLPDGSLEKSIVCSLKIHVISEVNKTIACDISKAKKDLGYKPLNDLRLGTQRCNGWCFENSLII